MLYTEGWTYLTSPFFIFLAKKDCYLWCVISHSCILGYPASSPWFLLSARYHTIPAVQRRWILVGLFALWQLRLCQKSIKNDILQKFLAAINIYSTNLWIFLRYYFYLYKSIWFIETHQLCTYKIQWYIKMRNRNNITTK